MSTFFYIPAAPAIIDRPRITRAPRINKTADFRSAGGTLNDRSYHVVEGTYDAIRNTRAVSRMWTRETTDVGAALPTPRHIGRSFPRISMGGRS